MVVGATGSGTSLPDAPRPERGHHVEDDPGNRCVFVSGDGHLSRDMSSETADETLPAGAHQEAAAAFVERARSQHSNDLIELYGFGSTVRDEATGRSSDVDVLIVPPDDSNRDAIADSLRDIAYDMMLEHGPLIELHILDESAFERHRQDGNPFVRNVLNEGRSYV